MDTFTAAQTRRLYQIFAVLSINVDSGGELQIGNRLSVVIWKQLDHGQLSQQKCGVMGCVQLIRAMASEAAHKSSNAEAMTRQFINKLRKAVVRGREELFVQMCDELSLAVHESRTHKLVPWAEYVLNFNKIIKTRI